MLVGFGLGVAEVFPEHITDITHGAGICGQLVLHLHHMLGLTAYLALALTAEILAHLLHGGNDDTVEEVVALDVEICGVGRNSEVENRLLGLEILFLHVGIFPLKLIDLHAHLMVQFVEHLIQMLEVAVLYASDSIEVGYGESPKLATAVHHDVPHKEREDDAAVTGEEGYKIEVGIVIERCHHTDIVQGRSIALIILYGIDEGVYDIGIAEHEGRVVVGTLQEIVIVGIDTCYHITSHTVAHEREESGLLALGEIGTRRKHHLEVACLVFELAEYHTPEEDVVVALDIGHDAASLTLSAQRIGSGEIVGSDMVLEV